MEEDFIYSNNGYPGWTFIEYEMKAYIRVNL